VYTNVFASIYYKLDLPPQLLDKPLNASNSANGFHDRWHETVTRNLIRTFKVYNGTDYKKQGALHSKSHLSNIFKLIDEAVAITAQLVSSTNGIQ